MWGATGERQTASELARLPDTWRVAHDVPDGRGNWDHIVIGPAGVFAISKWFSREARVVDDTLSSGRIRERGTAHRGRAVRLKEALERETGDAAWGQAVVAIWEGVPSGQRRGGEGRLCRLGEARGLAAISAFVPYGGAYRATRRRTLVRGKRVTE
jgi:hypothetical protein